MKIITKAEANSTKKPEGISTDYYLFDEFEVHYNEQPAGTTQVWHHHEKISETIFIIEGELIVEWKEGTESKSATIKKGDLILVEKSPHTFSNKSGGLAKFLVFKQVLTGQNHKEIFKNDKVLD